MSNTILLPDGWQRPRGFSHGIKARGETVFTGGIVGWDAQERFVGPDMVSQFEQILRNTVAVLATGGARPEHIVRMTWYLLSRDEYVARAAEIGAAYRELMTTRGATHYPAMTAVQVSALIEPRAKVEIEVTAIVPG